MKRAPVKILPRYTMSITGFLACAFGESFFRLSFAASRIRFPERSGSFFFNVMIKFLFGVREGTAFQLRVPMPELAGK